MEKCIISRLKTVVFLVMGTCNLNGHYRRLGLDLLSGVPRNFFGRGGGGFQQIQLGTLGRENADLGAVTCN
jgi:hypothetical protein